jgi:hypothetical protein
VVGEDAHLAGVGREVDLGHLGAVVDFLLGRWLA